MRFKSLSISNFRGFGAASSINLDGDLVLFFGPNGFGKTSVAEAVEWLFYGTTKRRQRGDQYSRSEYAGSFANVHGGAPVNVEAVVRFGGTEHTLSRTITTGENSQTFVDGAPAPFSSLNISAIEAVYPVIAQHGLQTFIHSKPKERRDAISAALGLDDLTTLKTALESARSSFLRTPPSEVVSARRELASNLAVLEGLQETTMLASNWRKTPMQVSYGDDVKALLLAANRLTRQSHEQLETALGALRDKRSAASKSVFDKAKMEPAQSGSKTVADIELAATKLALSLGDLERAVSTTVASVAAAHSAAYLQFWDDGLKLSPAGEFCPMCEQPTLDAARRSELARRLEAAATSLAETRALETTKTNVATAAAELTRALTALGVQEISAPEREILSVLFAEQPQILASTLPLHEGLTTTRRSLQSHLEAIATFLDELVSQITRAENAPTIVAQAVSLMDKLTPLSDSFVSGANAYLAVWADFEKALNDRVSSDLLVQSIDAVGKSLASADKIRSLDRYASILEESQGLIRSVEGTLQAKQNELLTTRGSEVKDLYDRLNRGADVGFVGMEPGTDSMKLHAASFGTQMSAAANLSECQLNCVGLSTWLMRATTSTSPFGFLLLDDPVQSMDDDHAEAFISDVVPFLMDHHKKQVLVLSHVQKITDRLRDLNQSRAIRHYHFDSYARSGPTITEQVKLRKLIAEIKGASRGNEENRKYSVDRIRVFVEHLIREAHLKVTGSPASSTFDRAQPSDLLPLFQKIPGTTPDDHAGLRDTVRFCDPAHHTEVGYSVPQSSNIQPHIDRLETLLKKFGL